ncbi:unnamed protein product [Peronospora belbahrii]|uniref:CCHC-type domain-containing protein n=1 Tax=Peronospora belbahrii TaxID=622444 RepID=A0AAU9KWT3_9STRA|nr:unnamed protein product [Peronospora belbahrii]
MGAANSVCKLTVDSIALLEQLEPNKAELAAKYAVQCHVQQLLKQEWPTCRVLPFGSSESGLGFGGCDVDLGIYFEDMDIDVQGQFSPLERVDLLTTACERLSRCFQVQEFIRDARVPVLKLWDSKRQVACDVCVGGVNALLNTALLKYYGQIDPRVRPLVFAVKYWAKQRGINDSVNGTLSSLYIVADLLLAVTLRRNAATSGALWFPRLADAEKVSVLLERLQSFPMMEFPSTFGTSAMNSVGALLAGFFDFYAHRFSLEDEVVSVRMGSALSKTTKWSHPVSWRLSIEDPFELAHDVGRVVFHRKGQDLIRSEFKRASDLLSQDHRLEDICLPDATSWNIQATCYICRGRDHVTRDCGQILHQRLPPGRECKTMSHFSDCWYCGEYGHYKAECPMLFFRDIPRRFSVPEPKSEPENATAIATCAPASPPIALSTPSASKTVLLRVCKERGMSTINSPMFRLSRKKKRTHHSSMSSRPSSLPSSSWTWSSNNGLSHAEKRQQQQRYQQQRQEQRHQNFALLDLTRKCGGNNTRSTMSQVGKVLCRS